MEIASSFKLKFGEDIVFTKKHSVAMGVDYLVIDMSTDIMIDELMKLRREIKEGGVMSHEWLNSLTWKFKSPNGSPKHSMEVWIMNMEDEEGFHWDWPKEIPVIWKKGPLTENFPGFEEAV